jgi:hypothetical protein
METSKEIESSLKIINDEFHFLQDEGFLFADIIKTHRGFGIIFVSEKCQVVFSHESGWDILFGPRTICYDGNLVGWVSVFSIFRFLLGDLPEVLKSPASSREEYLIRIAGELEPIFPRVKEICISQEIMSKMAIRSS